MLEACGETRLIDHREKDMELRSKVMEWNRATVTRRAIAYMCISCEMYTIRSVQVFFLENICMLDDQFDSVGCRHEGSSTFPFFLAERLGFLSCMAFESF